MLDNPTDGQPSTASTIRWDYPLIAGSTLAEPRWSLVADWNRRFVWSLLVDSRSSRPIKPGSIGGMDIGLRSLNRWMVTEGLECPAQLDADACSKYVDLCASGLAFHMQNEGASGGHHMLWKRLRVLELLFRQGPALADSGIDPMPQHPFGGRRTTAVVNDFATRSFEPVPPLPDEVLIPIVTGAWRHIGCPAEDIIRLQELSENAYWENTSRAPSGGTTESREKRSFQVVTKFKFSTPEGEKGPWRESIATTSVDSVVNAGPLPPRQILRNLVCEVRDAAALTVLFTAGIRPNELCGIDGGRNVDTKLPKCVEVRTSRSGLNEIFVLHGWISKGKRNKVPAEWVIGLRAKNSGYIPPAVHAVDVLERLFKRWRELGNSKRLIVGFCTQRGLPKSKASVSEINASTLLLGQRNFILRYIDLSHLPDVSAQGDDLRPYRDSNGVCIINGQWRKSWATYVFRVNSRLIPAIAQQFKHVNLAVTEQSYVGNDPRNLEDLDGVRLQQTIQFFYQAALGKTPVAGRLAKLVDQHVHTLREMIDPGSRRRSLENIKEWVLIHDIRIWFNPHGKCFVSLKPTEARCHNLAGTSHWSAKSPNFEWMEPDICMGCACFAIDGDHTEFWQARFRENKNAFDAAVRQGYGHDFEVARLRAQQAQQVLRALGQAPEAERES